MGRVSEVLGEAIDEFESLFGRRPIGALTAEQTDDADVVMIACNTMARTLRRVVRSRRENGERVGMIRLKMFRPFPREALSDAIGSAVRVGVLDRNHSPGSGGIFWQEVAATVQSRPEVIVQDYLVGLGGGDVTPELINKLIDDLQNRDESGEPIWQEAAR
jgi:pyruvate/2-oxoacid:ferredoxin oxidoreductase alpha subunit